jgi:hypothetical protein
MTGPSPSASTYVVRGKMETVELMPHCFSRAGNAGEMTEEPKELFELLEYVCILRQEDLRCKRYYCGCYYVHNLFPYWPVMRIFRIIWSVPIENCWRRML